MFFILLHIIFSSFFILCVRWSQQRKHDVITIGTLNYIFAGVVIAVVFLCTEQMPFTANSLMTGTMGGVCYFVTFFFLIIITSWKGAANTTVVSRLSIVVPVLCGILFWHERPNLLQSVGIILACASLTLVARRTARLKGTEPPPYAFLLLAIFFLMGGCCRLSLEMFKHICQPDERPVFVLLTFGISGLASIVLLTLRRRMPTNKEFAAGIALGFSNLLQTCFILMALKSLPGYVVFPMTAAGSLLFTTMAAVFFLNERLSRLSIVGLGIAVCSLSLLHPIASPQTGVSSSRSTHRALIAGTESTQMAALPRLRTRNIYGTKSIRAVLEHLSEVEELRLLPITDPKLKTAALDRLK